MSFKHYSDEYAAKVRAEHPDHFVVERITATAACLVLIPDGLENRKNITARFPVPDASLIDGVTFDWHPTPPAKTAA